MSRTFATGIVLLATASLAPLAAIAQRPKPASKASALQALAAARPDVQWSADKVVTADLDCDGRPDYAALGRSEQKVFVGVVGSQAKPEVLQFAIDPGEQAAICAEPATLRLESLEFDPREEVGNRAGFRRFRECKGLQLSGGECDAVHIFWSHDDRRFTWSRN